MLKIFFGKQKDYSLQFNLLDTPITDAWIERMHARHNYDLDDRERFYYFNDIEQERITALEQINQSINLINQYSSVIDKKLYDVTDQDTLNYLHHIFEIYHRGLDEQDHEFWINAPVEVQQALAQLNIQVHRCEALANFYNAGTRNRRFVCTWFGLPKTVTLPVETQTQYGETTVQFGGVYLKYAEIGKRVIDLATDQDQYIADEMFKPFTHISADFEVCLYNQDQNNAQQRFDLAKQYYQEHKEYFSKFGIHQPTDSRVLPFNYRVAQLVYDSGEEKSIIDNVVKRQFISDVRLI